MKSLHPAIARILGTTLQVLLWAGTLTSATAASAADGATATNSLVSYVAYRFDPGESGIPSPMPRWN